MRTFFVIIIICVWAASGAYAQQLPAYEMPRTQVAPITDRQEDRQYELIVKLPDSYAEDTDRKFPVIYTTDAVWHMDMLSGATEYLMPDVILVGVSWQKDLGFERPHDSRFRDYSFVPFSNPETQAKYQGGKAGEHLDFFRKDVFPYVEKNYRADPNDRTLFGYSLGGDFSAFVALAAPKTFKYYIIGSPSVSQKEVDFLGALEPPLAPDEEQREAHVFISIGELEDGSIEPTQSLLSLLDKKRQTGLSVTGLEIIEGLDHSGAFPDTMIQSIKWLRAVRHE